MASFLAEPVLFVALVVTSGVVALMYRELRRQNRARQELARTLAETSAALAGIDRTVRDFDARGDAMLKALGTRIEQGREILAGIEARTAGAAAAPTNDTVMQEDHR